jgi:hypothetical protein
MLNLRDTLLAVAAAYDVEAAAHGGKSLARVSTIVLNQGGFFQRLKSGKTCTLESFEALLAWFWSPSNWPSSRIPGDVESLLAPLNREPASAEAD